MEPSVTTITICFVALAAVTLIGLLVVFDQIGQLKKHLNTYSNRIEHIDCGLQHTHMGLCDLSERVNSMDTVSDKERLDLLVEQIADGSLPDSKVRELMKQYGDYRALKIVNSDHTS